MKGNSLYTDKQLFAQIALGDEIAFRQIVDRYHKKLVQVTISLVGSEQDARDIIQAVFLKLWLKRSELADLDNPIGWLRVVAANTSSNHIRSRLRYELKKKNLLTSQEGTFGDMEGELDIRFEQAVINEAINKLSPKKKQVFLLSRREGLSRREIADQLSVSENTVRNQLAEATSFIRDYLERNWTSTIPFFLLLMTRHR